MKNRNEIQYVLGTYVLYGLLPIFWKFLSEISPYQILAHRIIWSSCFLTGILVYQNKFALPSCKTILVCLITGTLLLINWGTFVYAIHEGKTIECSLGYFLYPIVNALLGFIFFKEAYNKYQKLAFLLFLISILYLSIIQRAVPYIPLVLAISLSAYALIRKKFEVEALTGLWMETILILPFACIYLFFSSFDFANLPITLNMGLIGTGIVTTMPLIFFLKAIKKLDLSLVGVLQYLNPTLQFLLAIFLFNESVGLPKLLAFMLIWSGILVYFIKPGTKIPKKHNEFLR